MDDLRRAIFPLSLFPKLLRVFDHDGNVLTKEDVESGGERQILLVLTMIYIYRSQLEAVLCIFY